MTQDWSQFTKRSPRSGRSTGAGPFSGLAAADCRHYLGHQPCLHQRACQQCPHYQPMGPRLCLIKQAPLAELLASLAIVPELRRRYREAHLTLVTGAEGQILLREHPWLDRVLALDAPAVLSLPQEQFELTINLDLDAQACALQMALFAHRRWGIGLSPGGCPMPLSPPVGAILPWLLDEQEQAKMRSLSYVRRLHRSLDLEYRGDRLILPLDATRQDHMRKILAVQGWRPDRFTLALDAGLAHELMDGPESAEGLRHRLATLLEKRHGMQLLLLSPMAASAGVPPRLWDRLVQGLRHHPREEVASRVVAPHLDMDPRTYLAALDSADLLLCGGGPAQAAGLGLGKAFVALLPPGTTPHVESGDRGTMLTLAGSIDDRLAAWNQVIEARVGELCQSREEPSSRRRAA